MTSCDPEYNDFYFVTNNCKETIDVKITLWNEQIVDFEITPKDSFLFYQEFGVVGNISGQYICKQIVIIKDGIVSQKQYLNADDWIPIDIGKRDKEWYLTINPEDFE
jgi:hypothetical protein